MIAPLLLLAVQPAAPVAPLLYGPAKGVTLECTLRAQPAGQVTKFSAEILAEDPEQKPASTGRPREIVISKGPVGIVGKHEYGWLPYRASYHTVQIQDYDRNTDYLLTLQIPKSAQPAGAMLYRWRGSDTVSVGYCTHVEKAS